jgi:hypothetical protein
VQIKKKKLLFVAKDPGGVNSIIPLIKKCQKDIVRYECIVLSHKLSEYRYSEENISNLRLEDFNYSINKKNATERILSLHKPDVIVTGSSRPYNYDPVTPEQLFVEVSKRYKIPSIGILDYWGEYLERFSSFDGEFNLLFVPDKVCALDQLSLESLLLLGIDQNNIEVTHNPSFDKIFRDTVGLKSCSINDKSEYNVLFISQPLVESIDKYYQGYSQIDMFNHLLIFLTSWEQCKVKNVQVLLHPKEGVGVWDEIIRGSNTEFIKIDFCYERDNSIFEWADFLVSGFSTLIYQALYYFLPVISIQIGLKKKDQLITNKLDLSIPLYSLEEMIDFSKNFDILKISKMLETKRKKLTKQKIFFSDGLASSRVFDVIDNVKTRG